VRGLSGHFFFLFVGVYLLSDCVFGSDADVSPVIGGRAPRLPLCVCFGSDADVSPVIGIQAPCLPLPVFVCVRVSRATNALILLRPKEIRMHRMRHPSEHVSFPQSELL
jgi:hypothetical protein